jgi:hypothetical protein
MSRWPFVESSKGGLAFRAGVKMAPSLGPFSNCQMRFPNRNERKQHTQQVISRARLRETELDTQDRAETDALRENLHPGNERKSLIGKDKLKLLNTSVTLAVVFFRGFVATHLSIHSIDIIECRLLR